LSADLVERAGLGADLDTEVADLSADSLARLALAVAALGADLVVAEVPGLAAEVDLAAVAQPLRAAVDTFGATVLFGTVDPVLAAHADVVVFLFGGRVVDVLAGVEPVEVARHLTDFAGETGKV
jgi:putative ABC transport system ATP-binding protein